MRDISPVLTPELLRHFGDPPDVVHRPAFPVPTYRQLVEHVARLSYHNKDHLLFFRGQSGDFRGKGGGTTIYPTIYRGARVLRNEVRQKFDLLDIAGRRLHELFVKGQMDGHVDIGRRKTIQWAILQHYGVCDTPLLDLTQSLRVACSFAQEPAESGTAFVYVLGLPHITNRISVNSEHDLIIVRLLSICPPAALRPYFQEGYLAGTADVTTEYEPKTELDFNRRIIAKFAIPTGNEFWGSGLSRVPRADLYPSDDVVEELCKRLNLVASDAMSPDVVGEFIAAWTSLERLLITEAQRHQDRVPTLHEAVRIWARLGMLEPWYETQIQEWRRLRNEVVHGRAGAEAIASADVSHEIQRLREELRVRSKRPKRGTT